MKKLIIFISILFSIKLQLFAQPSPSQYYYIVQEDSTYYLLSDKALFKFYSHEASGDFFLTNYIEDDFTASTKVAINDQHLFIANNDTLFYYSNTDPWDLTLLGNYTPGYSISRVDGFGPYLIIRTGNFYNLLKIENGTVITLEDSLFVHPAQKLVFFTYPFVVVGQTIYKYVENFDFYAVASISIGNVNLGITGNTIIGYYYWLGSIIGEVYSILHKYVIEEPSFPHYIYENWGLNIPQIHINMGHGTLIAKKNLYFMTWAGAIVTHNSQLAYVPTSSEKANITDYYIFLLGGDTLKYSKWNQGSTFYPLTWIDLTTVKKEEIEIHSFKLSQNYPNPFNSTTKIRYSMKYSGLATLKIFDVLGNELAILVNEIKSPGEYEVEWDAEGLPSGIYLYKLQSGSNLEVKKMVLLK